MSGVSRCSVQRVHDGRATGIITCTMKDEAYSSENSCEELTDEDLFSSLDDVLEAIWWWMREYS